MSSQKHLCFVYRREELRYYLLAETSSAKKAASPQFEPLLHQVLIAQSHCRFGTLQNAGVSWIQACCEECDNDFPREYPRNHLPRSGRINLESEVSVRAR